MVGRAAPISIAELRAVVAQVRALDRAAPTRTPRPRGRALAAFLAILAISLRAATIPAFLPSSTDLEENQMRSLAKLGVVSSIAAITSAAAAQNAVQWRVQDGGNGHWYQLYKRSTPLAWHDAMQVAQAKGGQLATLTTATEDAWVRSQIVAPANIPFPQGGPWLGGTCEGSSWGEWRWITGEKWYYSSWAGSEPNNIGGREYYVQMYQGQNMSWNDNQDDGRGSTFSAVIEWSADCNNDGIVDYGQILSGELADTNQNGIPDCCENGGSCNCSGDTNNDRRVDGIDLATVLARWGMPGAKFPSADCNDDGLIDGIDLAIVLGGWGVCQ